MNNIIYEEKGVVVRLNLAIHADQSVSFVVEWNGLRFAFSSDTLPIRWWLEHTKGVDLSIHECFIPPELLVEKYGMSPSEAVFVGTQGQCSAVLWQNHVADRAQHAVCYHFQNDHDTAPAVEKSIRETYDGPLDLALDFMTWNFTKDGIRTRMAIPNEESVRQLLNGRRSYRIPCPPISGQTSAYRRVERESAAATNAVNERFN